MSSNAPALSGRQDYHPPAMLYSPRQVDAFQFDLQVYLEWLREETVRFKAGADPQPAPSLPNDLMEFLSDFAPDAQGNADSVEQAVIWLAELRKRASLVHVILPTFASGTIKRQIIEWFRREIHPDTLLTFAVDTSILGGIVLRTQNSIYDFSFEHRLMQSRDKLPEIMRNV